MVRARSPQEAHEPRLGPGASLAHLEDLVNEEIDDFDHTQGAGSEQEPKVASEVACGEEEVTGAAFRGWKSIANCCFAQTKGKLLEIKE